MSCRMSGTPYPQTVVSLALHRIHQTERRLWICGNSTRCRCSVRRCKTLLVDSEGRHHHLQRGFRPGALIRTELTSTIKAATRRLANTRRDCWAKLIHPLTIACSLFFQQCTGLHRLRGSNVRSAQPGSNPATSQEERLSPGAKARTYHSMPHP
ncbi:hypothetical protein BD413DRAFT_315465 [Trametes elegans]|nr:hypothetical protein BD413DRAFT_315465 [Trametes elegans]